MRIGAASAQRCPPRFVSPGMSASIPDSVLRIRSKQSRLFLLAQLVALTLDHERMTVMEQPVENRRGEDVVAEDGAPLRDELIGRDQQAGALVPTGDELKKEVGAASTTARPSAIARCVLPTPGAPKINTLSACARKRAVASSRTSR